MAASRVQPMPAGMGGRRRRRSRSRTALPAALGRSWPSLMAGAVSLGLLATLAWQSGGYFPDAYLGAGSVAFGTLALILLVRPPYWALSTPALLALTGLGGLAAWTALSTTWSPAPAAAMADVQRDLLYLGLFALAVIAAGTGRLARHLVWLTLGLILLIVGAGLLARLF